MCGHGDGIERRRKCKGKEEESTHLGVMLEIVVGQDPDVTLDLGVRLRGLGDGRKGDNEQKKAIHGASVEDAF